MHCTVTVPPFLPFHSRFHCLLHPLEELTLHLPVVHLVFLATRQLKVKDHGPHQAEDQLWVAVGDVVTGDALQPHVVLLQALQSGLHILTIVDARLPCLS